MMKAEYPAISKFNSVTAYLKARMEFEKTLNPARSLRYFAQRWNIFPSNLSEIISGRKGLSKERALQIAKQLKLCAFETELMLCLTDIELTTDPDLKEKYLQDLERLRTVEERSGAELAQFRVLAQWYNLSILQLLTRPEYQSDLAAVAHSLAISPGQVEQAVQEMITLGMIKYQENKYLPQAAKILFASEQDFAPLKYFHELMLSKAQRALFQQTVQERHTGSETMMIDPAQLAEAKRMTNNFLDRLSYFLGQGQNRTQLYHVQVNLFSLMSQRSKADSADSQDKLPAKLQKKKESA